MSVKNTDIRASKKTLRDNFKKLRKTIPREERDAYDERIAQKILNLWAFRETEILLIYVSGEAEVDTHRVIKESLRRGKRVGVPKCLDTSGNMDFYFIESLDDLEKGLFGLLEPIIEKCEKVEDYSRGLCILPALTFDLAGYRLGFGKGYYDRFLSVFQGKSIGICYECCLSEETLPHGRYDKKADLIVTEKRLIRPEGQIF